jgi:hypothetical protein
VSTCGAVCANRVSFGRDQEALTTLRHLPVPQGIEERTSCPERDVPAFQRRRYAKNILFSRSRFVSALFGFDRFFFVGA